MPVVTRSTSGGSKQRTQETEELSAATTGTTMESVTETSAATTTVPTADATVSPMPVAAAIAAVGPPLNAAATAAPSRRSNRSKKQTRLERIAIQEENLKLQHQLMLNKLREERLRLEEEEDDEEEKSRINETDVNDRVRSWLDESAPLLAINDTPYLAPAVPTAAPTAAPAADAVSASVSAVPAVMPSVSVAVPAVPAGAPAVPAAVFAEPAAVHAAPATVAREAALQERSPPPFEQKREAQHTPSYPTPMSPPQAQPTSDLAVLAEAITTMARSTLRPHVAELPSYNGSHQDWLAFYTAYKETAHLLSALENKGRLRRCLHGRAREAVANLLINEESTPEDIVKTLETNFGRSENLAVAELNRLRNLPKCTGDPRDICFMANQVKNAVTALHALKKSHFLYNYEVMDSVRKKMPESLQVSWFLFKMDAPEDEAPLTTLANFFARFKECAAVINNEDIKKQENYFRNVAPLPQRRNQRSYATQERDSDRSETTTPRGGDRRGPRMNERERRCPICEEKHVIQDCKKFMEADTDKKWDLAKKHRLCFRCLRYRTQTHHCRPLRCNIDGCFGKHHKLLHYKKRENEAAGSENRSEPEAVTTTWTNRKSKAYLKIVPVRVSAPAGEIDTWALLDDGSTVTLIDSSLADKIGARGPIDPLHIEAITEKNLNASRSRRVSLTLRRNGAEEKIYARTIDCLRLSPQEVSDQDIQDCKHLCDIKEEVMYPHAVPRILIGQDNWHLLLTKQVRKGRRDQPVASLTPLGWVLHGAHTRTLGQRVNFIHHLKSTDDDMNEQLRQHFAIDNLLIEPKRPSTDPEQRAMKILENNTVQRADGHYEAALLWKSDATTMPNNYENALRRLHSVERKIEKDPALKKKYHEQMDALVSKGYAEPAPEKKVNGRTWYLPHFGVINPMKPDKLRIVHDAAARTGGTSLNDRLLSGPDLLQSLPGVLMRFRQHRIAVSADIAEMFMQVKIREEDRDFLRYLWQGREYRMTSLIFGATCSPSTAIYVKNVNAKKYEKTHPEAAAAIVRNHYVDDYLDSYENEEDAARIATEVRNIHQSARLQLRKWVSNSSQVLKQLIDEEGSTLEDKKLADGASSERVLGLVWKHNTDELTFNLDLARIPKETLERKAPTKREALKIVMSLYDPMGFAAPVVIKAKQLLQEVWRRGTDWDNELDDDLAAQWRNWMVHLENLRNVSVPRCYLHYSDAMVLQLHTFVDASETAYAAAVYWRAIAPDGRITLTLVMAKAKVAPLKLTSIPRLELQAAVMGSRMAAAVIEEHDRKPESKTYWTDSKTVLTWVKTGSRSYKPFVAHRIAAIEENTAVHEWRWVPTKLNVADDATRDVPNEFNSAHRWYTGSEFLLQDEGQWPIERSLKMEQPTGEEKCMYTRSTDKKINECVPNPENISSWLIYLRATARVLQFIELCRKKKEFVNYKRTKNNENSDKDWKKSADKKKVRQQASPSRSDRQHNFIKIGVPFLKRAEIIIVRAIQERCFYDEINLVKNNKIVARNSRLYALSLCYENEVLRLKSRINAISDVTTETAPPILDGNDRITKLYIEYVHRKLAHAGTETTINECRQHYWIIRVRPTVKTIVNECILCRIRRASPPKPSTGNHPSSRLAHHQRPFTYTGLDYFGPLTVTVGRTQQKRYVAIFTCLTTRAIHLELATTLSTDSAVMALRRMIARRGCPTEIWSDNGTNLHGADRELRRAMDEATHEEAEKRMISWRYIPLGAPFMGGAWERLVRSVKTALAATQQSRNPTEEVLVTLLAEAEYTVNSRPLTHVSVHHEDEEALTPNHFLLGGSALTPAPGTFTDGDLIGRATWRASQRLADMFWARWLREYLPELQNRREPHNKGPAVKTGDVVLIVDNTLPRNTWPRGVVTATFPGPDGVVRAAEIKTQGGTLRRPTKKLVIILPKATDPSPDIDCNAAGDDDARREECSGRPLT